MVARRPKLIAAGLVLLGGMALAWPLRRNEPLPSSRTGVAATSTAIEAATKPREAELHASGKPVLPKIAETPAMPAALSDRDPFADVPPPTAGTATAAPPLFSTISSGALAASAISPTPPLPVVEQPTHRIHVVHEGDSLDRLAKRYLGDEARALEIFDLNREVLDNPHLLRLGTELKIPVVGEAAAE